MSGLFFQVLGAPRLSDRASQSDATVRFRYRDTWLLLATLALDPVAQRRDSLILRIALDDKHTGREKLRVLLNDLRHGAPNRGKSSRSFCGVGAENVLADSECVFLRPGAVRTDLADVELALEQAASLIDPERRAICLRGAAALLRGGFLEGYEISGEGDGWLERMRFDAGRLSAEVWRKLAQALDESGERRNAFDAARRAYAIRPDSPEALELLLDLADSVGEQVEALRHSGNHSIEELIPLLEGREREGRSITITEEHALAIAVQTRLTQLAEDTSRTLRELSGFPDAFTPEQARAIVGVEPETLKRIVNIFPFRAIDQRYVLLPTLRNALRSLATNEERMNFQARHAHYFQCFLAVDPPTETSQREKYAIELERDAEHIAAAIEWFSTHSPTREGVFFFDASWAWLSKSQVASATLQRCRNYLEKAVDALPSETGVIASELLGTLASEREDFREAVHWLRLTIERFQPPHQHPWLRILLAAHHANDDALFDEVIEMIPATWPGERLYTAEISNRFYEEFQFHIAENRLARSRYAEALEHNDRAMAFRREWISTEDRMPSLWGQRASILTGLGRTGDAEKCWDIALLGFEEQGNRGGMADCCRELGRLAAESGRVGLGISLIQQAILLFEEVGNQGAVLATKGTLGDILLDKGEIEKARMLYSEGLKFWKSRNHPRWTKKFENRLQRLQERTRDSCKFPL